MAVDEQDIQMQLSDAEIERATFAAGAPKLYWDTRGSWGAATCPQAHDEGHDWANTIVNAASA